MANTKDFVTDICAHRIPSEYIRPVSDRPNFHEVQSAEESIPLIDLQDFHGLNHGDIVKRIGQACELYGFLQVKNHGIPERVINNVMRISKEYCALPGSERLKSYSNDPSKNVGLSTSFTVETGEVANWRDFLRLHCYPLDDYINERPSNPPFFRADVAEYCTSVRELGLWLIEAISESSELHKDSTIDAVYKPAHHINFYPPCPEPELTYGSPVHTDSNLITIRLPDDVPGLQVLRNGKWIAVNPIPGTFIVNIGDQIEALSNGRYKVVHHRAVVNSNGNSTIQPTELIDHEHHAVYGGDYQKFWNLVVFYISFLVIGKLFESMVCN